MKAIKKITMIAALLLGTITCIAQVKYYSTTKTFNQCGYTYQCDVKYQEVTLYNKANKRTYTNQIFKATGKEPPLFNNPDDVLDDDWTRVKSEQIVNAAFSTIERQRVRGSVLGVSMFIDPDSGRVIEVKFETTTFSPFATIPVSVYRKIETDLKDSIWFTPTTDGKKLNYIYRGWNQYIVTP